MKYAFIFPGQGSQSVGMGKDFYENFTLAKKYFEEASDAMGIDMKELLFEENDKLALTSYTQPAIFLISTIAYQVFQSECPLLSHIAMGHSLGEVSAVIMSNGISFADGINLTHQRGKLMTKACEGKDAGMMVVVGLDDTKLETFCQEQQQLGKSLWCANYNGNGQIVLAGKKDDLLGSESQIKALGAKKTLLLPMSVASHCPLLEEAVEDFKKLLEQTLKPNFSNPILSNATLEEYTTKSQAKDLLGKQLTYPVLYKQSILKIHDEVDAFIEFGYGNVLKGLNKRLTSKPTWNVGNLESLQECIKTIKSNNV